MIESIYIPIIILGSLGLLFGIGLSVASKFFEVKADERIESVRDALPGINCGACGYSGCDAFAESIVNGEVQINGCSVGGEETSKKLARIMGIEECNIEVIVARVNCNGTISNCEHKQDYYGIESCSAAQMIYGGVSKCNHGCIGLGDCERVCPFDAIQIIDGLAIIYERNCKGCRKCIAACPKSIIDMVPQKMKFTVACKNKDKGAFSRKQCKVSCIGCGKCVKVCPEDAISVESFLAKIDYSKCINCGKCVEECPTNAIREYLGEM